MKDPWDWLKQEMEYRFCGPGIYADHFCSVNFYLDANEEFHKDDGPAIRCEDGSIWFRHGQRHRDGDLPAVECKNGDKAWWFEGRQHREKGPAVVYADGSEEWWLKGVKLSEEDVARYRQVLAWKENSAEVTGEILKGLKAPVQAFKPPLFVRQQ